MVVGRVLFTLLIEPCLHVSLNSMAKLMFPLELRLIFSPALVSPTMVLLIIRDMGRSGLSLLSPSGPIGAVDAVLGQGLRDPRGLG